MAFIAVQVWQYAVEFICKMTSCRYLQYAFTAQLRQCSSIQASGPEHIDYLSFAANRLIAAFSTPY